MDVSIVCMFTLEVWPCNTEVREENPGLLSRLFSNWPWPAKFHNFLSNLAAKHTENITHWYAVLQHATLFKELRKSHCITDRIWNRLWVLRTNKKMSEVTDRENSEEERYEEYKKLLSRNTSRHNQTELLHRCLPHRPESHNTVCKKFSNKCNVISRKL